VLKNTPSKYRNFIRIFGMMFGLSFQAINNKYKEAVWLRKRKKKTRKKIRKTKRKIKKNKKKKR
jgi:hypothetical protein